ncbi:ASCH domain-containing protein
MVAYGFKKFFSPQIEDGSKMQTIRADRPRHARPGETVQLYEGMRTRHCRKIVADATCIKNLPIRIRLNDLIDGIVSSIEIDGQFLNRGEIEVFARRDGFGPDRVQIRLKGRVGTTARENMGLFWRAEHPDLDDFHGRLIIWKPAG